MIRCDYMDRAVGVLASYKHIPVKWSKEVVRQNQCKHIRVEANCFSLFGVTVLPGETCSHGLVSNFVFHPSQGFYGQLHV